MVKLTGVGERYIGSIEVRGSPPRLHLIQTIDPTGGGCLYLANESETEGLVLYETSYKHPNIASGGIKFVRNVV